MGSWVDGLMRSSKWQVRRAMRENSCERREKRAERNKKWLPIVWWLGHPHLREPSHFFLGRFSFG